MIQDASTYFGPGGVTGMGPEVTGSPQVTIRLMALVTGMGPEVTGSPQVTIRLMALVTGMVPEITLIPTVVMENQ
jgi:hypothetical protein